MRFNTALAITLPLIFGGTFIVYGMVKSSNEAVPSHAGYTRLCIDGVTYMKFAGYRRMAVTPKFKPDSTVELCGDEGR